MSVEVSVVCNAYNHEKYIRSALEGFAMQKTSFPFEVLVHDDASTDRTAEIIREYEIKYPDIIKPIYSTENQYSKNDGSLSQIQNGRVQGKYIALCEGDDYWTDPLKLQKQYDLLESHPEIDICATAAKTEKNGEIVHQSICAYLLDLCGMDRTLFLRVINKLSNNRFYDWCIKKRYTLQKRKNVINHTECEAHNEILLYGLKNWR